VLVTLGEVVMILDLHREGMSISAIARRVGLDRKTVSRYIDRGLEPPAYGPRERRATKVGSVRGCSSVAEYIPVQLCMA
jgi:transposase